MKNRNKIFGLILIALIIVGGIIGQENKTEGWVQRAAIEILWNIGAAGVGLVIGLIMMKIIRKEVKETCNIVGWILICLNMRFLVTNPDISFYSAILFIVGAILLVYAYLPRRTSREVSE
jgi:formate-dependent nitrite reductase membrane component NrfD